MHVTPFKWPSFDETLKKITFRYTFEILFKIMPVINLIIFSAILRISVNSSEEYNPTLVTRTIVKIMFIAQKIHVWSHFK